MDQGCHLYACAGCGVVHTVRAEFCARCAKERVEEEERSASPDGFRPLSAEQFRWLLRKVHRQANLRADAQRIF